MRPGRGESDVRAIERIDDPREADARVLEHLTSLGSNPSELQIEHDRSFRMAALSVRGQTVVIVIQTPAATFAKVLPVAERLLASLRFPAS